MEIASVISLRAHQTIATLKQQKADIRDVTPFPEANIKSSSPADSRRTRLFASCVEEFLAIIIG